MIDFKKQASRRRKERKRSYYVPSSSLKGAAIVATPSRPKGETSEMMEH